MVVFTFVLISSSDEATDLVLNCPAFTFIVELDDDLNHRDEEEIKDLVKQSVVTNLIRDVMRESQDETIEGNLLNILLGEDIMSSESTLSLNNCLVDREFLKDQLDSHF